MDHLKIFFNISKSEKWFYAQIQTKKFKKLNMKLKNKTRMFPERSENKLYLLIDAYVSLGNITVESTPCLTLV
jgi:hypothetical protein